MAIKWGRTGFPGGSGAAQPSCPLQGVMRARTASVSGMSDFTGHCHPTGTVGKQRVPALPSVLGWGGSLLQPGAVTTLTPELVMGIAGLRLDSELAEAAEVSLPPLVIKAGAVLLLPAVPPIPAREGCALATLRARFLPLQA